MQRMISLKSNIDDVNKYPEVVKKSIFQHHSTNISRTIKFIISYMVLIANILTDMMCHFWVFLKSEVFFYEKKFIYLHHISNYTEYMFL